MVTVQTIGTAETSRWQAVTGALAHQNDAIAPPTMACRLGGYQARFFHSILSPFLPSTLNALS